jgi:ubiquinone biosynthesis protein
VLYFLFRSLQIGLLLPTVGIALAVVRLVRPASGPGLLRWYLQTQGGVFVKLGQFLAMRYDLLSPAYCQELSKLLDRMPPLPVARILAVVEQDLGRPAAGLFASFDSEPLGSASIAQVHRATLPDGRDVAVKVMRPGIEREFDVDFRWMGFLATVLEEYLFFVNTGVADVMAEVVTLTREELDFRREIQNLEEMHRLLDADDIDHSAPAPIAELCGARTITMEFIDGVAVTDMIDALDAGDEARLATWAPMRITPERTARLILRSVLEQTMRHRLFQSDPHAANLIMRPDGSLGWLDFGILGWLDEKVWQQQYELREAVADERIHRAFEIVVAMFAPVPRASLRTFEPEVKAALRDWIRASRSQSASISDKSTGLFFLSIMSASRRAGIRMPMGLTRLFRAIIIADIVVLRLDPAIDWMPIVQGFLRDERERQAEAALRRPHDPRFAAEALQLVTRVVPSLLALSGWVERAMPELDREYRRQLTALEATVLILFRYGRIALLFVVLGLIISLVASPAPITDQRWAALLLSGVTVLVLTRLIRVFR